MSVEKTLEERGARYGSFSEHAKIAQSIQDAYRVIPSSWNKLPPVLKQGLTTIADKIARMLNGDHMYEDNVHDIIGYAKLMENWIKSEKTKPDDNAIMLKQALESLEQSMSDAGKVQHRR
jgi:hypothetical protein